LCGFDKYHSKNVEFFAKYSAKLPIFCFIYSSYVVTYNNKISCHNKYETNDL